MDEEMKSETPAAPAAAATTSEEKRFEIKKWNAVALWSWGAFACARLGPSTLEIFFL
jgi:hypothetical protein